MVEFNAQELSRSVAQGRSAHNIIGGRGVAASTAKTLPVTCPSDGIAFASIPDSDEAEINMAVAAARQALETGPWAGMTATERGRLLTKLGLLIEANADELALTESRETGKPIRQGIADVQATIRYFEYYGGAADKIHGDTIPFLATHTAITTLEPHGVVAGIIPWNYPMQIFARVAGAALAMGNTLVMKPAEDASLTSIRLAELALEVGFPDGVLNVVTGLGTQVGAPLSRHPDVDYVTFTGSPPTGSAIQTAAAGNNRGVTMELGGKSPQIIFEDADLEVAIPVLVNAIIQNGGQTCSAGSRILIQQSIYDRVAQALAERFSSLVAEPHWRDGDLGALINRAQTERVKAFVDDATASGIQLLAEGKVASDAPAGGNYQAPMLFGDVPPQSTLFNEEVFGPVLALTPFGDERDAVGLANATPFGLVAGVWTLDGARQHRVAKKVRAGQVYINGYGAGGGIELPFGGFKKSGFGREKGFEALKDMSATKTIIFNHG
ncbi:MAG: aldehyde dehydrogenase family protein [Pseudomonadota bacterium]